MRGDSVILLHGLGRTSGSMARMTTALAEAGFRTLNLDYPSEDDLERGAIRNYDYIGPTRLPR